MGWSPYYPAGVTDEMIDRYFGEGDACCKSCQYYRSSDCSCALKEEALENDLTAEELEDMTQNEYYKAISTAEDDYCDEFEYKDNGYEEEF